MMRFILFATAAGLGLTAATAVAAPPAVYDAPANISSVIMAASWENANHAGPGTWVRGFYAGDGDGQSGLGPTYLHVGSWDGTWRAPVFRFLIPAGTVPTGHVFDSANFSVFIGWRHNNPAFNLDLHAVHLGSQGWTSANEYEAVGTPIQLALLNTTDAYDHQRVNTDIVGDANLMAFLNANYWPASNAGADDVFLALRLRMDGPGDPYTSYALVSNAGWGQSARLQFTTIPEPAALSLLGLAGLGLLRRRKA